MFKDNIETLDFATEPEESRDQINKFVEEVTKENIKNLLPPGSIGTDTNVVLANAAFFKGNWASKFDVEDTQKKIFYEHSRMPVYVDMMRQRGYFNYGINYGF
jgi:serine protease inhibitor